MAQRTVTEELALNHIDAKAERATDAALRKAGVPLYWCEAIQAYVTVPEREQ